MESQFTTPHNSHNMSHKLINKFHSSFPEKNNVLLLEWQSDDNMKLIFLDLFNFDHVSKNNTAKYLKNVKKQLNMLQIPLERLN